MIALILSNLVRKFERLAKTVEQDLSEFSEKEITRLFNEQINPLADKLDYIAEQRSKQSKAEIEELETKTDIKNLLNHADEQVKFVLAKVEQLRQAAIADLSISIAETDAYLENRINHISLIVMQALSRRFVEINILEDTLFQDANYLMEQSEILIDKTPTQIRRLFRRYSNSFLPSIFDSFKQKLKLTKPGFMLSEWELYQLSKSYELSKLNPHTPINDVLKIYGQMQYNSLMIAALCKNAPSLHKKAVSDWIKYGVLCNFWRNTIKIYASTEPFLLDDNF